MPAYRSRTSTHGRNMAGARGLCRATGVKEGDFGKPIIAIANSFTQFVPGHVHLKDLGQLVAREVKAAGAVPREFNTIAVDDGIAMGHGGMLYSLPSRELIADSVEYMVNAHCADAMVCISNCDKITPGMLLAAMRLNIPTVFVSGGPMEAGVPRAEGETTGAVTKLDLIDPMIASADPSVSDERLAELEEAACPTCGACRACARWRRAAATTWRTCTGPAASPPSWASWTGPACSTRACTRCTAPRCGPSSTSGTSVRRRCRPRRASCSTPRRAGSAPSGRTRRTPGGAGSMRTGPKAASGTG